MGNRLIIHGKYPPWVPEIADESVLINSRILSPAWGKMSNPSIRKAELLHTDRIARRVRTRAPFFNAGFAFVDSDIMSWRVAITSTFHASISRAHLWFSGITGFMYNSNLSMQPLYTPLQSEGRRHRSVWVEKICYKRKSSKNNKSKNELERAQFANSPKSSLMLHS